MNDAERIACIEAWSLGSWGDRLGEVVRICIAVENAVSRPPAPITSRTPLTYNELDKLFMDWNAKCWGSPSEAHHRFARAVLKAQKEKT